MYDGTLTRKQASNCFKDFFFTFWFQSIKDVQLLAIIGVLVAVILVVIIIWELVAPHYMIIQYLDKDVSITMITCLFPRQRET